MNIESGLFTTIGQLIIQFQVVFPTHVNPEVKQYLRLLLDPDCKMDADTARRIRERANQVAERQRHVVEQQSEQQPSTEGTAKKKGSWFECLQQ